MESSLEFDIKRRKKGTKLEIGRRFLKFMIEREVIFIKSIQDNTQAIVKKKGKGYLESKLFVVCHFDLHVLP